MSIQPVKPSIQHACVFLCQNIYISVCQYQSYRVFQRKMRNALHRKYPQKRSSDSSGIRKRGCKNPQGIREYFLLLANGTGRIRAIHTTNKRGIQKKGEEEDLPFSSSIGAIYNNTIGKENIDELIDRCGKMRLLNEKHAEAEFSEGKMKML